MAVVLVVAMALPFLLPPRYSLFPQWLMPALLGALLVTLIIADPGRIDRRSELIRACSIALVVVLCLGAAFFTGRLVVELVHGSSVTNSAALLLRWAASRGCTSSSPSPSSTGSSTAGPRGPGGG